MELALLIQRKSKSFGDTNSTVQEIFFVLRTLFLRFLLIAFNITFYRTVFPPLLFERFYLDAFDITFFSFFYSHAPI